MCVQAVDPEAFNGQWPAHPSSLQASSSSIFIKDQRFVKDSVSKTESSKDSVRQKVRVLRMTYDSITYAYYWHLAFTE